MENITWMVSVLGFSGAIYSVLSIWENHKKIKELEVMIGSILVQQAFQENKIDSLASHLNLEWRSKAVKVEGHHNGCREEAVLEYEYVKKEPEYPTGSITFGTSDSGLVTGVSSTATPKKPCQFCGSTEHQKCSPLTPKKSVKRKK
jgi:hypothetical protein